MKSIHFFGFLGGMSWKIPKGSIFFHITSGTRRGKFFRFLHFLNCHSDPAKSLHPTAKLIGNKDTYPLIRRSEKFASPDLLRQIEPRNAGPQALFAFRSLHRPHARSLSVPLGGIQALHSQDNPNILPQITKNLKTLMSCGIAPPRAHASVPERCLVSNSKPL
jgi:hypothetical protein